ncbi:ubiquitin carboxyl-terminal hydrolase 12-like protein, partial [Tanacetum coccineum]
VPEEEKDLGLQDCLIPVNHAPCWNQIFGDPFLLVVHEGETLAEVKVRIQKKLEVSDEEFSKWKFSHVSWGLPTPLQDSDIVLEYFQNKDVYGVAKEHFLQVEHSDNSPKRAYTANQVFSLNNDWETSLITATDCRNRLKFTIKSRIQSAEAFVKLNGQRLSWED